MKKAKAFIFGMAILLGTAGAFNNSVAKSSAHKFAGVNWVFNGSQEQIDDPSQYSFSSTAPACSGSVNRCGIVANRSATNPSQPDLSTITQETLKN